jgi:DNA-binding beta-propeller fold protein YncE
MNCIMARRRAHPGEVFMRKTGIVVFLCVLTSSLVAQQPKTNRAPLKAAEAPGLRLIQVIPFPDVVGRIDHLSADTSKRWVFVSALGSDTVEVVDGFAGRVIQTLTGLNRPQGVVWAPEVGKLYVANAGNGKLCVFTAPGFTLSQSIDFGENADNLRYDAKTKRVYVAYGEDEHSGIGVVDAVTDERLEDAAKLGDHPESFQLEQNGNRIFANMASSAQIAVVDRTSHRIGYWPLPGLKANFPMALDEADHRLFVGTRTPPRFVALDTTTGKIVSTLPSAADMDDVWYDTSRKRIYLSGAEGVISVVQQLAPDHYREASRVPSAVGARTSFWYPQRNRFYLAVPARADRGAELYVYEGTE